MDKLFKTYLTGILLIIFGQLLNGIFGIAGGYNFLVSGTLIALLLIISIKVELMKKKEFLFIQFGLIGAFFLLEIVNYITVFYFIYIIRNTTTGILTSIQVVLIKLIPILGYLITILCLIRYNMNKNK